MTNLCLSMWICQFGAVPGSEIIQRVTFSVTFLAVFGHCVHCSVYQDFLTYGGIVFHRMCVTHLILSSIYGYLSCFYCITIMNNVVYPLSCDTFSNLLGVCLEVAFLGLMITLCLQCF